MNFQNLVKPLWEWRLCNKNQNYRIFCKYTYRANWCTHHSLSLDITKYLRSTSSTSTRSRFEIRTISALFVLPESWKLSSPCPARRSPAGTFPHSPLHVLSCSELRQVKPWSRVQAGSAYLPKGHDQSKLGFKFPGWGKITDKQLRVFLNPTSRLCFTILNL